MSGEKTYIATFFIHYDAICFAKELNKSGYSAQLMPVPRRLSSSCGTCVQFTYAENPAELQRDAIEQIIDAQTSSVLWDNR